MGEGMKRKILFLDSNRDNLNSIQAYFKNMSQAFCLYFVDDINDAYDILDSHEIEVLVSSLNIDDFDGIGFFVGIKHRYPEVIRILLADPIDKNLSYKLIEVAHQYIRKPVNKEKLKLILFEALSFKDIMTDETVLEIINDMDRIPSLPTIYSKIVEKLWANDSSIDELADLISQDIGMSSKILQLVNSAFLGMPKTISSIREAVSYMGLNSIRTLVLMINVFSSADKKLLKTMKLEGIWGHSFMVADYAQKIATDYGLCKECCETCFTAGLLHSTGRVVMALNFPEKYRQVAEHLHAGDNSQTISDVEREYFGADHCEIGGYLLGIWGVPHSITNAVLYHNQPSSTYNEAVNPLIAVHIANVFAHNQVDSLYQAPVKLDQVIVDELELADKIKRWQCIIC